MIVGSSILHLFKYGSYLSNMHDDEVFITPLISSERKNNYKDKLFDVLEWKNKKLNIFPIYLNMPNNNLYNLFNPTILFKDFFSILMLLKRVKPNKIICMYILDAYPFILLRSLFKYSISIFAIGGDVNLHEGFVYRLLRTFICRNSDLIFAVSHDLKNKLKRESGSNAIVIPTGIDPSVFQPINSATRFRINWGLEKEDFIILTVCNLIKSKGIDVIIKSLDFLKDTENRAKLLIAGDGPEKSHLEELVKRLKLGEKVFFLGHRSRTELVQLYNLSNIFILASYSEGLPSSLLEAMACGCICISTNVGDVSKAIIPGLTGFLINPGDAVELADQILHTKQLSKEELHYFSNNARKTVLENYDLRILISKIINLISVKRSRARETKEYSNKNACAY